MKSNDLKLACDALKIDGLALYRVNQTERTASLMASVGDEPRQTVPFGVGPIGNAAESGKGLVLHKSHRRKEKYQSILYLPIEKDQKVVGVLVAATTNPEDFREPTRKQQLVDFALSLKW